MYKSKGITVWLTGLSGAGKTTIAELVCQELKNSGLACYVADGDTLRSGISSNLGFSRQDRFEHVRRAAEVAVLFSKNDYVVLVPVITPYTEMHDWLRKRHEEDNLAFVEVYVATSLGDCESRDPKGLYKLARGGSLEHFTGIDDVYEKPVSPDLILDTARNTPEQCAKSVISFLYTRYIKTN